MNLGMIFLKVKTKIRLFLIRKKFEKQLKKGELNVIFVNEWYGFASRFVRILELLYYCDINGLQLNIRNHSKLNEDLGWDKLMLIKSGNRKNSDDFIVINDISELPLGIDCNLALTIVKARDLINKYIVFDESVMIEIETFQETYFEGKDVLGIHYRGTDKYLEAESISYADVMDIVQLEIKSSKNAIDAIFVSTDEQAFIEYISKESIIPVIYREDSSRSTDGEIIHRGSEVSDLKAIQKDAMVNMMLLAKCNFLIKSSSCLSDCSLIFNEYLDFKYITQPKNEMRNYWPIFELLLMAK